MITVIEKKRKRKPRNTRNTRKTFLRLIQKRTRRVTQQNEIYNDTFQLTKKNDEEKKREREKERYLHMKRVK